MTIQKPPAKSSKKKNIKGKPRYRARYYHPPGHAQRSRKNEKHSFAVVDRIKAILAEDSSIINNITYQEPPVAEDNSAKSKPDSAKLTIPNCIVVKFKAIFSGKIKHNP